MPRVPSWSARGGHAGPAWLSFGIYGKGSAVRATTTRRGARLLLATALVSVFSLLAGPGTAYALGGIGPVVPINLPAGIGYLEAVIPGGLTVGGAALAAGEGSLAVGGGVIAGAVLVGGGLMYLSWKLGDQVGTALPCLDCGPSSSGTVLHGCPAFPGALAGTFEGATIRCAMDASAGLRLNVQPRTYAHIDRVCGGVSTPWTQTVLEDYWNSYGVYGYQCADPSTYQGINLRLLGGTVVHLIVSPTDVSSGGSSGAATGDGVVLKSSSTIRNPDGSSLIVDTYSDVFRASDPSFPPITVPALQPGQTRTSFGTTVVGAAPGSTIVPTTIVPTTTLPTTAPANRPDLNRCLPGGADYPCAMVLTLHLPGGATRTYDPSTDYKGGAVPDGVWDCTAGGKVVPVSDCSGIYKQVPRNTGTPTPLPTEPTPDAGNCVASGVSFNPISWVYVPVKCALIWAFVPPAGTLEADMGRARSGFDRTGLPAWGSAVGGVGVGLSHLGDGAGGCSGPHFDIRLHGHAYAFDPLNACSSPMSGVAVVVKLFASLAVLVAGARLCARPVMAAIGMGQAV